MVVGCRANETKGGLCGFGKQGLSSVRSIRAHITSLHSQPGLMLNDKQVCPMSGGGRGKSRLDAAADWRLESGPWLPRGDAVYIRQYGTEQIRRACYRKHHFFSCYSS